MNALHRYFMTRGEDEPLPPGTQPLLLVLLEYRPALPPSGIQLARPPRPLSSGGQTTALCVWPHGARGMVKPTKLRNLPENANAALFGSLGFNLIRALGWRAKQAARPPRTSGCRTWATSRSTASR